MKIPVAAMNESSRPLTFTGTVPKYLVREMLAGRVAKEIKQKIPRRCA
jgi:hypothetical protein